MNAVVRSLSAAALLLMVTTGSAIADTPPPIDPVAPTVPAAPSAPASPEGTPESKPAPAAEKLHTEVVFCIDCSGSMSQSLERAQQAIRFLIDEMQARTPDSPIRVGIIRYGTGSNALEVCPISDDPKTINQYLSKIQISGGAEFVGTFIQNAVERMKWSDKDNVVRQIVMVGNETAFQGPVDYRRAAKVAFDRGFTVSAMYCPALWDEQGADTARATATTRTVINGVVQTPGMNKRGMLDVENTWLLTAYFGGGEVMKLSADYRRPLLRYSPDQVVKLVEEIIPRQQQEMANADAAFAAMDLTGRFSPVTRGTPVRRR